MNKSFFAALLFFVLISIHINVEGKIVIVNKVDNEQFFCINGYTFPTNHDFSTKLGDRFVLVKEEKETLEGDAGHRVHYELENFEGTNIQHFTSKFVNTSIEIISDAMEIARDIREDYSWMSEQHYWIATIYYTITLADEATYDLCFSLPYITDKDSALNFLDNFKIEKNDLISFGNSIEEYAKIFDQEGNHKYNVRTTRKYDKIFEKYSENESYTVAWVQSMWPFIVMQFDDFGKNNIFYIVSTNNFFEAKKLSKTHLKYIDRYNNGNKNFYRFTDMDGNEVVIRSR